MHVPGLRRYRLRLFVCSPSARCSLSANLAIKAAPLSKNFLWERIAEKNQARDCKFILQYYLEYASKHTA